MVTVRLIADDLTGALDAGAQFVAGASGFSVWLDWHDRLGLIAAGHGGAITTENRERAREAARDEVRLAAPFVAEADLAFLKIDSLLRGNWPIELAEFGRALPRWTCLFAPAVPAEHRITEHGRQIAPLAHGAMVPLPLVPGIALAEAGLPTALLPRGAEPYPFPGGVLICDAREDGDLERLAAAGASLPGRVLWCGAAGLARALGAAPPSVGLHSVAPLVIVGSAHPATQRQLGMLPEASVFHAAIGADPSGAIALIGRRPVGLPCVVSVDLPPHQADRAAAVLIAERLAAVLPALPPPEQLVVIGGETLGAVCRAIKANALAIEGEWRLGTPASRIIGGVWHGVPMLSRSGAFGRPEFFLELFASVRPGAPVPARLPGGH